MNARTQPLMLDLALAYAERGLWIFPCAEGRKEPACANGLKDATTDPEVIKRWWGDNPNFNIGCAPDKSGHVVLDIDVKKGANGRETLGDLELEHGAVSSGLRVRTPSGGEHIWLKGSAPSSAGKLGPGLDTRGAGGFVLLPPSRLANGVYEYIENSASSDAPSWLLDKLKASHVKEKSLTVAEDTPLQIEEAKRYLALRQPVSPGSRGATAYKHACRLRDIGLSQRTTLELLSEWEAQGAPQEHAELAACVEHAYRYAQNEQGSKAPIPAAERFAHVIRTEDKGTAQEQSEDKFRPYTIGEMESFAEPEWLVDGWFMADSTAGLYAPPGSFKSFVALDLALSIAAGIPFMGLKGKYNGKPRQAVYAAGEGSLGIARYRVPAWRQERRQGAHIPFYLMRAVPLVGAGETDHLIERTRRQGLQPSIIVLDTAARMLAGLNENDAGDMGELVKSMEALRRAFAPCLVLALHHSGKDLSKGARGSTAFLAGVDTAAEAIADKDTKTLRLVSRKQRDADDPKDLKLGAVRVLKSLVFNPLTAGQIADLERDTDPLSAAVVRAALRRVGPATDARGVTTEALAAQLGADDFPGHDPKDIGVRLKERARAGKLNGLWERGNHRTAPYFWRLPDAEENDA